MATRTVGPGKTYATISAAITAASANDTIEIYPATYTESVYANKVINFVLPEAGKVKIVSPSNPMTATVFAIVANCTVTGHVDAVLHLSGSGTNTAYTLLAINGNNQIKNITLLLTGECLHVKNWGSTQSVIERTISVSSLAFLDDRGNSWWKNLICIASTGDFFTNAGGNGTFVIDHFLAVSAKRYSTYVDATDVLTLKNGIFIGAQVQFYATGTNTCRRDHNVIFNGGRFNGITESGAGGAYQDNGFNVVGSAVTKPYLLGPRLGGYDNGASLSIVIDDGANMPTFQALCGYLDQYGLKASIAVVNTQMTGTRWADLKALTDNGHGAVSHTWNHCNLRTLAGFWIIYNGSSTNPKVSYDGTTLSVTTDGGVDALSLNVSGYTYINDMCDAFHAALGGSDKWRIQSYESGPTRHGYTAANITGLSNQPDYDYVGAAHRAGLATFSNQPCSTVYTGLLDLATFMDLDLVASRNDINTRLGIDSATFVYPGSYINATQAWDNYFESIGFLGARSVSNRYETFDGQPDVPIPIFYTGSFAVDNFVAAGTTEQIKSMVHAYCAWVIATGTKMCILGHGMSPASNWQPVVEAIAESGVNVVLYDQQIRDIRANWTRDTSKGWPEYKMTEDAYADLIHESYKRHVVNPEFQGVGAGLSNLTVDFNRNPRLVPPTIGPLEIPAGRRPVTSRNPI